MTSQAPRPAFLLAVLAVILTALLLLWQFVPGTAPARHSAAIPTGGGHALQWRVGQSQRYQVDVNSSFLMTMPGASGGQAMNLSMAGDLDFRTLAADTAGVSVGMRLDSLSLEIDGAGSADVNHALESPFRVRFDLSGRVLAFEFPATLAQEHRDILENLVRMFQVVVADGTTWETEETNANGRYKAHYARITATRISKQKSVYLPSITNGSVPEVDSEERILLEPEDDWITEMRLDERITIDDPDNVPVQVTNHATIKLVSANDQVAVGEWGFASSAVPDTVVDPQSNLPTLSPQEAQRQLATAVEELEGADETRSLIIHRLRDLLLIDDQLPGMLIETLRIGELSDRTRADLYLAFELAGTPASQAALSSVLLDSSWPPMDAMRAIVALGGVDEPTEDTLATLWDLAHTSLGETDRRDLPGTAALAIGSLGSTLRESGAADYTALRADLLVSASGATAPQERAVFLYALGNTEDPDPVLKRDLVTYLDDPSSEVRSAAARTLERLGAEQVQEELLARVQQEPSGQARAAMVEALGSRDKTTTETMQWARSAVRQEPDERARYNMAVLLGENLDAFPENREVLEILVETEQSKRIRQKVANMLYIR